MIIETLELEEILIEDVVSLPVYEVIELGA